MFNLEDAKNRTQTFIGHGLEMVAQLCRQTTASLDSETRGEVQAKIVEIYEKATEELRTLQTEMETNREKSGIYERDITQVPLTAIKRETAHFKKEISAAPKKIAAIISEAAIAVVKEVGKACSELSEIEKASFIEHTTEIDAKIARLARGGIGGQWTRLMAFIFATDRLALKIFENGHNRLQELAENQFHFQSKEGLTKVDRHRLKEFSHGDIARRAHVLGIDGTFSIAFSLSPQVIKKQLKSFSAQHLSNQQRLTIEKEIKTGETIYISKQTPLNQRFDAHLGLTNFFGRLFGNKGISSMNREEGHLINPYDSKLFDQNGNTLFDTLRHGITSQKFERNRAVRKAKSEQAARELLTAALLKEVANRQLTIDAISSQNLTIPLTFNSVSLVTPDIYRALFSKGANERTMLADQLSALYALNGEQTLVVGKDQEGKDIEIKANIKINAFNFGVNLGAVSLRMGLKTQYRNNRAAFRGLRQEVETFRRTLHQEYDRLLAAMDAFTPGSEQAKQLDAQAAQLLRSLSAANQLITDIALLMKDENAYLEGGNQYEIGAKILLLTHLMEQTTFSMRKNDPQLSGYQCATNCMSGKDRTGLMDAAAKSFAILAANNQGHIPTHAELMVSQSLRKEFVEIFITVLLEGGGLEITQLNTGAKGYKIEPNGRLYNEMELKHYLLIKLFSATTNS